MENQTNQTVVLSPEQTYANKATTAMVFGIVGLSLIILPGFNVIGLALSIVGLVLSVKSRNFASEHAITENNQNKAGFVCSLIGTILGGLSIVLCILAVLLFASLISVAATTPEITGAITEALPQIESAIEGAIPGALNLLPSLFTVL